MLVRWNALHIAVGVMMDLRNPFLVLLIHHESELMAGSREVLHLLKECGELAYPFSPALSKSPCLLLDELQMLEMIHLILAESLVSLLQCVTKLLLLLLACHNTIDVVTSECEAQEFHVCPLGFLCILGLSPVSCIGNLVCKSLADDDIA